MSYTEFLKKAIIEAIESMQDDKFLRYLYSLIANHSR